MPIDPYPRREGASHEVSPGVHLLEFIEQLQEILRNSITHRLA